MPLTRTVIAAFLALAAGHASVAAQRERNFWPAKVEQLDEAGQVTSWEAAGPLVFWKQLADGSGTIDGVRGIYIAERNPAGLLTQASVLYPLFIYRSDGEVSSWRIFQLINRHSPLPERTLPASDSGFDVWPFYFSRQTGFPETSYRALLPFYGTVKNRFFHDRLSWVLFPLYLEAQRRDVVTKSYLWPFVRQTRGTWTSGFQVWPLFGRRIGPTLRHEFILWPFIYRDLANLDQPVPTLSQGVLPFYASERGPGLVSRTWLWPFFGYVDRTEPHRYRQTNYFWPLFLQGRGDDRIRNRWAPFYTYSSHLGADKTWVLWPVYRRDRSDDKGVDQIRTRVLFFLYNQIEQRAKGRPDSVPAVKRHLWPLFSYWDNGAGRRQLQVLSPFEPLFPGNDTVRESWTPLTAIYKYDSNAPDGQRTHRLLWNMITWRRGPDGTEFHFGPLQVGFRPPAGRE